MDLSHYDDKTAKPPFESPGVVLANKGGHSGRMTEPVAFISLARRLGNPIAEIPEAVSVVALSELSQALRATRRRLLSRAPRDCIAWLRTVSLERPS